ncbi:uncharacterized protein TM35_000043530 [Trypanosoma theileri]|uniref:Uncharacterized protein n=1 Tax=Trypanosoma theileri TaxID=67003 RepID=A0A1X0P6F2_9TRYP|nr:uncharacterized protein TM35_000043530 [Trypanosoma theileri]ORC92139.1 hypothetical protein TM35_000043530 [Trypanosoma theileri]
MSSSDDEWLNPPTFNSWKNPTSGGRSGESELLAARRAAAQRQREEASRRVVSNQQLTQPLTPALDVSSNRSEQKSQQQQSKEQKSGVTEEMVETLRRELEAKKKLLDASKEKENALREKWRAQKAQRSAEISQLDMKIRRQQDAIEEMKSAAEREVLEIEDEQQKQLKEERIKMETAIREEYEPLIESKRNYLEELKQKEAKLKAELNAGDSVKDLVSKCIGSALNTILQRVDDMFAANSSETNDWETELQRLVRREVRSSFAVTTDSEAQHEREDYQKYFKDTLEFWRKAEEEEREYVLKMDEQLLLDLQSMIHDDLNRLQHEEMSMEELYVESREAWAAQHQEMLKREMEAAMNRRAAEFEEQRTLRHQLHLERMKAVEEKQRDMIEKQRWFHEKQMALLREQHAKEEQIAEMRARAVAASEAEISRSIEEFTRTVQAVEGLLERLKEYRSVVEDGRTALDCDQRRILESREATLSMLQDVVTKQTVSVSEEHNALSATLGKLETVRHGVQQHLEEERVWLGQQQAKFAQGKADWEREYRRWRRAVEEERCHVRERFGGALSALRHASEALAEESRGLEADRTALEAGLHGARTALEAEGAALRERADGLRQRGEALAAQLATLGERGAAIRSAGQQLQRERASLVEAREGLRREADDLRHANHCLQLMRGQLHSTHAQQQTNAMQYELRTAQGTRRELQKEREEKEELRRRQTRPTPVAPPHSSIIVPTVSQNTNRLPLRVLTELREMLGKQKKHHHNNKWDIHGARETITDLKLDFNSTTEPEEELRRARAKTHESTHRKQQQQQHQQQKEKAKQKQERYVDPNDPSRDTSSHLYESSNNFTYLIPFSDTGSTQTSLQTSA